MSTTKKRKLRAIFFADIVGYTSLMQKDEAHASILLQKFRNTLNEQVSQHEGEVINNYGDGCLCTFESAVDAMTCAKEVQLLFQKEPIVPVRIGLHSGDVFFEDDNVFGDSVNIASRIESLGVPGAVLFSNQIKRHISNQKEFEVQSLGEFDFKNVEKTMEVFALANKGFIIPKKEDIKGKLKTAASNKSNKWRIPMLIGALLLASFGYWQYSNSNTLTLNDANKKEPSQTPLSKEIREKRVAVMVFENQTMSEEMDAFGKMISDWVTRGLMETGEANVISAANIQNQIAKAGLGQGANPEFAANTGVDVMLQGRYYLQENRLIIHANIVEIASGEVIHALTPIEGDKSKMIDLLDELTQEVLGYWAVKKTKRFLQNPPKYEAYKEFEKGEATWSDNSQYKNAEKHLKKAYELDPTFYAPLLKLIMVYSNRRQPEMVDSIINHIAISQPNLTEWESLRFDFIKAFKSYKWLEAGRLAEQQFLMDPSDISANSNSGYAFINANHPKKALAVLNALDTRLINKNNYSSYRISYLSRAHLLLGDYQKVIEIAENDTYPTMKEFLARNHLFALAQLDQRERLSQTIKRYNEKGVFSNRDHRQLSPSFLHARLCNYLKLLGQKDLLQQYARELMEIARKDTQNPIHLAHMADAAIYLEDWQTARNYLEQYANKWDRNTDFRILGKLGVVCVKLGETEKVNQILQTFDKNKAKMGFQMYDKAKIFAALGDKEAAMQILQSESMKGATFSGDDYHFDSFLMPLFDYPPFVEFVKPKG